MHRFRFVLYRPVQLIPVLLGISLVTFVLVHLIPGDPARILLGVRGTQETIAAIHRQFGLDRPILVQYLYFLFNLLAGNGFDIHITGLIGSILGAIVVLALYGPLRKYIRPTPEAKATKNTALPEKRKNR